MSEVNYKSMILEFAGAFETGDLDKMLSLFTDDIILINPFGTFEGKAEAERFLSWNLKNVNVEKISEEGIGILVEGHKAFYDHKVACKLDDTPVEFLVMSSYEFSDGKFKLWRQIYDRLSIVEQTASGILPQKAVGAIVQAARKGLD
jgi:limonene-1,2-epoxide hydrolase